MQFIIFVLSALVLFYIVPQKYRYIVLSIASIFFFISFSKWLVFAVVGLTLILYFAAIAIEKRNNDFKLKRKELEKAERKELKNQIKKKNKTLIVLCVSVAFASLAAFKYLPFLTGTVKSAVNVFAPAVNIPILKLIMPIGVSYYTLSMVGYITDVYRGVIKAQRNPLKLLLFATYFPYLVEGPICSYGEMGKQFAQPKKLTYNDFLKALERIILGLIKKMIIADRAAIIANVVFDDYAKFSGVSVLFAMFMYTINIYFDFSGCMDLIRGVSLLFGIELPENFRQPFFSKSVQEFWRRWHITLGEWIKKYIFYPVSLSKANSSFQKKCVNSKLSNHLKNSLPILYPLLFVWLFNGIWHGASWKYVLYGIYYYIILSLGVLLEPLFEKICSKLKISRVSKPYKVFQILRTCVLVMFGLTIFRADSISAAFKMFVSLFNISNSLGLLGTLYSKADLSAFDYVMVFAFTAIMFIISLKAYKGKDLFEAFEKKPAFRWLYITIGIALIVTTGVYGTAYTAQPFVYAQF